MQDSSSNKKNTLQNCPKNLFNFFTAQFTFPLANFAFFWTLSGYHLSMFNSVEFHPSPIPAFFSPFSLLFLFLSSSKQKTKSNTDGHWSPVGSEWVKNNANTVEHS